MMRALFTSATGMQAQQTNMDVISNNLANVNTTGFKSSRANFEDLIYQQVQAPGATVAQGATAPNGMEIGLGVRPAGTEKMFTQGDMADTGNPYDVAISGSGFFKVLLSDGTTGYTRDGNWNTDSQGKIVDSNGNALQPEIVLPSDTTSFTIGSDGTVTATRSSSTTPTTVGQITLTSFINPAGLSSSGDNIYKETVAAGTPQDGTPGTDGLGTLSQDELEGSNVSIVNEMVNMIVAQRAYETNSKAIQSCDDMLNTANQLKQS